jgi:hypothetical protein
MTCEVSRGLITVPGEFQQWARDAMKDRDARDLTKIASDVWATELPVAEHTDGTADGLITYGCIIVNDWSFYLQYREAPHRGRRRCPLRSSISTHSIPVGALYKIDGRIPHSTVDPVSWLTHRTPGLFAALIWDMPPTWSLLDFRDELLRDPRFQQ